MKHRCIATRLNQKYRQLSKQWPAKAVQSDQKCIRQLTRLWRSYLEMRIVYCSSNILGKVNVSTANIIGLIQCRNKEKPVSNIKPCHKSMKTNCTYNCFATQIWLPMTIGCLEISKECSKKVCLK